MKAVVVDGPQDFGVRERPAPAASDRALVRVEAGGICGTDLKIVHGQVPAARPVILGHEIVGRVEVPAPDPSALPAGTRVVVDPSLSCGRCEVCRRDLPHLCPNGGLIGRDSDGGFASLLAVPGSNLHELPQDMPADDCVLLQVLSTCVHAQSRISPQLGQAAVVIGLGVTGLLHLRLLAARGITPIVGISRSAAKRSLATGFGATAVAAPDQALATVADVTAGNGAGIVIECAGQPEALAQATAAAGHGASLLMFGTISPVADRVPTYEWYRKELTLLNTRAARPRDFTAAIQAVTSGLISPGRLITARYPIEDASAAIDAAQRPDQLKVTLAVTSSPGTL